MLRRWWRRKSGGDNGQPDADEAGEEGELVRAGALVELRTHVPANRPAFQRWYADPEIATLLRHDLEPLSEVQSRGYFDTFILPLSARGLCYAIHERETGRLIGTTALTDFTRRRGGGRSALFRIVIGEKDAWGHGYGTEATRLVAEEGFEEHDLDEVRLEVFRHNPRAVAAYRRVGFRVTGEHVEWVSRRKLELQVIEMALDRDDFEGLDDDDFDDDDDYEDDEFDDEDVDDYDDDYEDDADDDEVDDEAAGDDETDDAGFDGEAEPEPAAPPPAVADEAADAPAADAHSSRADAVPPRPDAANGEPGGLGG